MDQDLFDRNMAAMRLYQPHIAERFEGAYTPFSRVVGAAETGNLNIDLGHTLFYGADAATFAEAQVENYLAKADQRMHLGLKRAPDDRERIAEGFVGKGVDYLATQGMPEKATGLDPDGGYLIVLGLGLGLHLEKLIDRLDIRSVIVVERFEEFVYHAMGQIDLARLFEEIDRRKGTLQFVISDVPNTITNMIFYMMRQDAFGLIDGSYIYQHYDSYVLQESLSGFRERLPVLAANPGFFEDELIMLRNYIGNVTRNPALIYADKPRVAKSTPVIICGSGPSVDQSVDFIRRNTDSAIIVSCGTGLGALLGYGIRPDYHVDIENTPGPVEIIQALSKQHKLSDITLIASNTVRPELTAFFTKRIMFFRDTVSSSKLFGQKYGEVFHAVPTVANTAGRIMLGLGFRNLHLVGVDLGARDAERHHGQHSVYFSDKSFLETHPEHAAAAKFPIEAAGNFGGRVFTNQSFLFASVHFSGLSARYRDARILNLSDGIRINGTIPCLPESAVIEKDTARKARDLERLRAELDVATPGELAPPAKIDDLAEALELFYSNFETLMRNTHADTLDLRALFDAFKDLLDDPIAADVDICVQRMHVGTMMVCYTFLYQTYRRMPQDMRAAFFEFFRSEMLETIDRMRRESGAMVKDLRNAVAAAA